LTLPWTGVRECRDRTLPRLHHDHNVSPPSDPAELAAHLLFGQAGPAGREFTRFEAKGR